MWRLAQVWLVNNLTYCVPSEANIGYYSEYMIFIPSDSGILFPLNRENATGIEMRPYAKLKLRFYSIVCLPYPRLFFPKWGDQAYDRTDQI